MGLYDRILFEAPCGGCGEKITEWQTKDTRNPALQGIVELNGINNFYSICYCKTWMRFFRIGGSDDFGFECQDGFPTHVIMYDENAEPPELGPRKRHGHARPAAPD